ncbi:NeuD/PglB/VioB family sugar acetyltransferase [Saccharothrix algeriensis]|uniref:NeuD/PglB/VioB family sugar acetyltransferase n=1 Tax=Saccharothrix algeriensis TaxID=173560 RepID=A0A8T8I1R4_9PSEU|nr:NeuD/PglB/VioB family sugar acetyltransferase [Saccharothrix algeriensis]MBM7810200.1 sugar O-acyltransferase (sialic acid O-acetyltransferase NeuD family) [Saccharothrix algeriensis]QTR04380.1 NeuD/PglB/VioB family sugar acetyltransferase [Saccharothrix algeriensis]
MAPRPLLLVGGGGLAREVLAAVRLLPAEWEPVGALDDDPGRHGADLDGLPVLGGSELVHDRPDAAVLVCVASARRPSARLGVVRRLGLPDERWATVAHPAACVPPGAVLGPGTVLLAGVVVTTPLRLGAHVVAMPHVLVTHDDEVGDGVTFAGRASLGGAVRVGESAYLGQGSAVREGVSIGAGAVVGMGSVVLSDVPAGEVWAGVPARRLREGNGS